MSHPPTLDQLRALATLLNRLRPAESTVRAIREDDVLSFVRTWSGWELRERDPQGVRHFWCFPPGGTLPAHFDAGAAFAHVLTETNKALIDAPKESP